MQAKYQKSKYSRKPAQQVSELIDKILEPVMARRAGMNMELFGAWPELVGENYALVTRPQKINWPRKTYEDDPFQPGELLVACEPAHALFFQHELTQIVERVNVFLGFAAIKSIRIQQKQIAAPKPVKKFKKPKLTEDAKIRLAQVLEKIESPELREKLEKLGTGIYSKRGTR